MHYLPVLDQILPQYINSLDFVQPTLPTRQALGSLGPLWNAVPYCREVANEKRPVNFQSLCSTSVLERSSKLTPVHNKMVFRRNGKETVTAHELLGSLWRIRYAAERETHTDWSDFISWLNTSCWKIIFFSKPIFPCFICIKEWRKFIRKHIEGSYFLQLPNVYWMIVYCSTDII